MVRRLAVACLFAWVGVAAIGCGAKTGLDVPDANLEAGIDAGVDAGVDAGRDASLDAYLPCIEIPLDGGVIELPLATEVQVGRADVVFAIDTTKSMEEEIAEIRARLRDSIAPGIRQQIEDAQLGVTTFADFPAGMCGTADEGDLPFRMLQPVTSDISRVQSALDTVGTNNGIDEPESQVEALYQIATGEGIHPWVAASFGCAGGGFGYPCFREDAVPIVMLFTDAPFHNGPGFNSYPYASACFEVAGVAHWYDQARTELVSRDIRVIGMYSGTGGDGLEHLRRTARDTGALDRGGQPLVYDIGERGQSLTTSVIDAITTLADVIEFDVDTRLVDPDRGDAIDPREFVDEVIALRAEPPSGVRGIERSRFIGVWSGTSVVFQLSLRNDIVAPGVGPQRFRLEVVFRADMRTRLGSSVIELVVPGADGSGCMIDDPNMR